MCAYRVLLVLVVALVLGCQSSSIGHPKGVKEFEKKLLKHFNERDVVIDSSYEDEPGSMTLFDVYIEMRKGKLITPPHYKARSFKLDMDRNQIEMVIELGTIDMQFNSVAVNFSLEMPKIEYADTKINMTDVIMTGNISIALEGTHFMPHIYDFNFKDKGGVIVDSETDEFGKSLGITTPTDFDEDISDVFQILTKPIYHQFQMDVNKILETSLKEISTDTIFKTGEELDTYRDKVSLASEKANKIIDDICNMTVVTGIFEDPIKDNGGLLIASDGTAQFGSIKRNGDFNSYDDGTKRYISGYITLDHMTLLNNYTTKYDEPPVTGTMKSVGKNLNLLMELEFEKNSCEGLVHLSLTKFGEIETHVTPENTDKLLHWSQDDLRLPLVGNFRIEMMSSALNSLVSGIQLGYSATPCKP